MTNDITLIRANEKQAKEKGVEICLKEESIRDNAKNTRELFSCLQGELDELDGDVKDGLSYLDMKNDTLLSYMIDLCNIILRKVRGEAISGHPSVERSVFYRVILEKIKAIDRRLAYQLNKVITLPETADQTEQGVNISNLDVDLDSNEEGGNVRQPNQGAYSNEVQSADEEEDDDDDDDDEEEEDSDEGSINRSEDESSDEQVSNDDTSYRDTISSKDKRKKGASSCQDRPVGVYRAPKLRSVAYDDGNVSSSRRRRDYSDFYQDDKDDLDFVDKSHSQRDDERIRYEEDNYNRLPPTNPKKIKRKLREKKARSKGSKKFKGTSKRK